MNEEQIIEIIETRVLPNLSLCFEGESYTSSHSILDLIYKDRVIITNG